MVCTTDHVKKREEYHRETHNVERLTFDQILPLCNRFSNGKKQFRGDNDLVDYITETFYKEVSEVDYIIFTEVIIPYRYEGLCLDDLFGQP